MFTKFKDYFNFNATERNGILVLILLILIVAFIPEVHRLYSKPGEVNFDEFQKDIEEFENNLVSDSSGVNRMIVADFEQSNHKSEPVKVIPFPFNPNNLPAQKWEQLGLKDWQIKIIQNFESRGGKFHKKEDLEKIYGIKPEQFKILEPFIILPVDNDNKDSLGRNSYKKVRKTILVDINSADTTTLQELKGIGPAFARRIAKYREMLGGFYSIQQLMEVYGFDQQKFDLLASNCLVGDGPFRKMNLNQVTTAELKKHPYLDFYIAKAVVDRRVAKGKYTSVCQLKEIPLVSDELYEKIRHYFTVE
jgi:competence protein ComEA